MGRDDVMVWRRDVESVWCFQFESLTYPADSEGGEGISALRISILTEDLRLGLPGSRIGTSD